jgi:hypothetical protein
VTDQTTGTQKCIGGITDYTGATKTVTLGADPGIFTMATGDTVEIIPSVSLAFIEGEAATALDSAIDANVTQILGTALEETVAGYVAAAFKKFFDVETPAKDINDVGGTDASSVYTYFTESNREDVFKATGFSTHSAADVWTATTRALTDKAGFSLAADQSAVTIGTVTTLTNLPSPGTDWLTGAAVSAAAVTKIQNGLATPTNITAGTMTTVTNLTNLPAITTDWLTEAGISTAAATKIATAVGSLEADTGVTLIKAAEMLAAAFGGRLVASAPVGDVVTLTYYKRDNSTTSFTALADETTGSRAEAGGLS